MQVANTLAVAGATASFQNHIIYFIYLIFYVLICISQYSHVFSELLFCVFYFLDVNFDSECDVTACAD